MKNLISLIKNVSCFRNLKVIYLLCAFLILSVVACQKEDTFSLKNESASESALKSAGKAKLPHQGNMVVVETYHKDFHLPDEILSGWTTFRYENQDHHTHFFLIEKMPVFGDEQKDLDDYFDDVVPVFDDAMDLINDGKTEEGLAEFGNLPAWSFAREYIGGVGLLGPGQTGQTMQYLEPGTYIMECYVKTNGIFHTSDGMAAQFVVKEEKSAAKPPKPTLHLYVDNDGFELKGHTRPGVHTMKVHYKEQISPQTPYSNFVGHDVNLVKIEDEADVDAVNHWMNWVDVDGLNTPAPATFLGGVQEMPTGSTAYVTFRLEPGQTYGIVAEIPNPLSRGTAEKGFFKTFTVTGK
jgi:hypothetical protein